MVVAVESLPDTFGMRALPAAALLAGCYAPSPPPGAPCVDGVCPTGLVCSPATNTCERDAVNRDGGNDDAPIDAPDASVSQYRYRRRITIQNNAAAQLATGYTVRLPLLTTLAMLVADGKVEADYADLRVIGDAGERDRIVDGTPAPPALSFSLAAPINGNTTNQTYYLYYGDPSATAAPANGNAVFALYDDFTSGISAVWQKNNGPTTTGGKLVLRASATDAIGTVAASDNVPTVSAVELVANVPNPASDPTVQPEGTFWYWFGYQRSGDFTATDPWIVWIARGKNTIKAEQLSPVGCEANCNGGDSTQNTAPHYYAIERDPSATRFYRDGALAFTATVTNTTDYSLIVRNYMAASDLQVDYVRARARITPEPTITLGAEESL
jgi:hypothetical protein